MFNKRTLAVIKRELREKLFSRTFIVMTLLIPIFLFAFLAMQTFSLTFQGNGNANLEIISESPQINDALQKSFSDLQLVKDGIIKVKYSSMSKSGFHKNLDNFKNDLLGDKLTGIVFISDSALQNKRIEYYSKNPNNNSLFNKIKEPLNKALIDVHFKEQNLTEEQLAFARIGVDFSGFKITADQNVKHAGYGNTIVAFLFSFLLYFCLMFLGTMVMRSVVQEKNNRIVEVLLSSVSSTELMVGKIIGNSITGLVQMFIWLLPLIAIISTSWFILPADLTLSISMNFVFYFLINYLIGLTTFLGLFTSVGAIFDNEQDSQSGMWPIMILIMIPFFISISLINNPENPVARFASLIPFASIIVMPTRMTIIDVPNIEIILSFLINVIVMFLIFPFAGKIYRVGVLMTGKKPKWSEVVKWVKAK